MMPYCLLIGKLRNKFLICLKNKFEKVSIKPIQLSKTSFIS